MNHKMSLILLITDLAHEDSFMTVKVWPKAAGIVSNAQTMPVVYNNHVNFRNLTRHESV